MYGADAPHTVEYQIYRGEATRSVLRVYELVLLTQGAYKNVWGPCAKSKWGKLGISSTQP